jgi:hypothetical protein
LSPRAPFLCRPERSEGSLGAYAIREDTKGSVPRDDGLAVHPSPFFVTPSPLFFLSPRAPFFVAPSVARGSLGAYAIREDTKGSVPRDDGWAVAPSPFFVSPSPSCRPEPPFLSPRGVRRGVSLRTLSRTK